MQSNYDPTDLRGQQLSKQEADARARVLREAEIADVKWLMSSPRGRRMMWRLLAISRVFQSSFDQNAMKMAFNEGHRNFGNQLFDEVMTFCPEMFPVMQREARDKEQQDGKRDGNGDPKPK